MIYALAKKTTLRSRRSGTLGQLFTTTPRLKAVVTVGLARQIDAPLLGFS
jgi:hypothetical protein